jgi:hypothetical protein
MKATYTEQQIERIKSAISESDMFIAKESKHSDSLRPSEIKDLLSFYKMHRTKLIAMLS